MTSSPWPSSRAVSIPVAKSQSRAVVSDDPLARRIPSGEKVTVAIAPSWASSRSISVLVAKSQTRTVASEDPVASFVPSGEKATL